ncbi:alanine racemase [Bacillus carboniphilus]|uniref:Alanine racemase n=1 Tax=Bacillus carboniphilus TaxID=86663 RepID=A0ABP3GFE3_9BACI
MDRKGKSIYHLDTPTLLLDIDKLKENINEMAAFAKMQGISLRPHIKTHKSIEIAKLQLEAGAVGVTTAKIGEAEVMAAGGMKDILIAYPISSEMKMKRLIGLMEDGVDLKISVDHVQQVEWLDAFFEQTSYTLQVWIKVNSGLNRCGVEPGDEVVQLARKVVNSASLKLGGIFTHAGHSYGAKSIEEIEQIGLQEARMVVESAEACEKEGIPIPVRSVGSTPTYKIAGQVKGITEVRPGNAAFFDAIQVGLGVTSFDKCALTLLASVVGVYQGSRVVLDTGSKSLCLDKGAHGNQSVSGFGHVVGHPELTIERLSEEHGVAIVNGETSLSLNDKVLVIPNHACTVANQFEEYVVHQNGVVVDVWKVDARGKVQ